mgnify:FL=1
MSDVTGRTGSGRLSPPRAPSSQVSGGEKRCEAMRETNLDNGVLILSEKIPGVRSAAIGIWIRQGAAHETNADTGASHLLEHMVFKGTRTRSALEIADSLETLGGSLDAYTSREHTSYQARVLDEHIPVALDVLSDLVLSPSLRDSDLSLEREVVLEEIAQVEDTPDDLVFEIHSERLWNGHPYGRSILGTKLSVEGMKGERLRELHSESYVGENLVIAAAGNVEHEEFVDCVASYMDTVVPGVRSEQVAEPSNAVAGLELVDRKTAQTHIVFGAEAPPHSSEDRYALILISSVLGGGMSSRLFQKVREDLGLCYSVFTFQSFYRSAGMVGVYIATRPATATRASEAVRGELERIAEQGLSDVDLDRIKQQVKGQVMLSLESTGARLHRLASFALHDEPFQGLDDVLSGIDAVTCEDTLRVAAQYYDPGRHLELRLGPS